MKYVLISPARNEQAFIEKTLASVCAQTVLPERWVIVDDGSTDRTPEIVEPSRKCIPGFNCYAVLSERTAVSPAKLTP